MIENLRLGLACRCPRCHEGALYKPGFLSFDLLDTCPSCDLDYTRSDSADGPAVFLIFILGFLFVPLALIVESLFHPPLWFHAIIWTIAVLGSILLSLKPLKSYIVTLQYRHRPGDWE